MKSLVKIILVLTLQIAFIACAGVSPKLDFDEQSELIQVKKEITGKIKGLKVTVDTSELKESKSSGSESSASSESGENNNKKKTVGVRTDVTFELSSGEEKNETKSNKSDNEAEDNASIPVVPIFKGKPERGGVGGNNQGTAKDPNFNELWSVKPLDNPTPGQQNPSRGGSYLPRDDPNRRRFDEEYPQYVIWTTERNHRRPIDPPPSVNFHHGDSYENNFHRKPSNNFIPYQIHQPIHRPHYPCDCKVYPGPFIRPLHSSAEANRNQKVDDKLDRPFSRTTD